MILIVLICSTSLTLRECTEETARAVIKTHLDSAVCGPAQLAITGVAGVGEDEFARIKCSAK